MFYETSQQGASVLWLEWNELFDKEWQINALNKIVLENFHNASVIHSAFVVHIMGYGLPNGQTSSEW